jgi:hypothetical protein
LIFQFFFLFVNMKFIFLHYGRRATFHFRFHKDMPPSIIATIYANLVLQLLDIALSETDLGMYIFSFKLLFVKNVA